MTFQNLVCPISPLRVNENVVRLTASGVALLVVLYLYTSRPYLILVLLLDFSIRAFTPLKYSPLSWLATQLAQRLALPEIKIDKAPKIFAARVGFLFSVAILLLFFIHPLSSLVVSVVLLGFALLEAVFNICAGCLVYSYVVFPFFKPEVGS
ncbi:MAG: DUF4395 domain-containing protein [Caldilineaceae bacterium]